MRSSFRLIVTAAGAVSILGLSLAMQTRAAQPQPAPQATAQPPAPPTPPGRRVGPGGRVIEAPAGDDPLNADADLSPKPPVLPLSPAEQAKRFWLPPGYRMEPVLADPVIQEPAQVAFDGNGRMFVLELRGYDQTLDGLDLTPPVGRISVHEDRDDDGVYEHHRVFVDGLVFPRFVLPFGANSVLTMESNAGEVWKYSDVDRDGTAEKKELFTTSFGRAGNVEHQPSSLFWGMDNWMYSTVNSFRVRWTPGGLLKEPTGPNGAQWGVTQDNFGKIWFQAGASGIPAYFQFPIHYGTFRVADQLEPDLNITWGAPILIGDIQAGMPGTRMPDGSLIRATAAAGNDIYRGDRLPADLVGHYLYGEVVARIVRRLVPVASEGLTQLRNAYPLSEFIRSLDPLFRPVDIATAPDGTLYIADMYRGVIEGAPWAKEGTYLRKKIDQYQLHKVLGKGRVWRLTYDGIERDRTKPRMLDETAARLVEHLSHPNGWWRDTAQQLLVLKQDASVAPALEQIVRRSRNLLARFHAMWTLEGLGALDAALVREQMNDPDPKMRIQAIRVSETLYKAGNRSFADDYRRLTKDADTDVVIQAMLTLSLFKVKDLGPTIEAVQAANPARGVQEIGRQILQPPAGLTFAARSSRGAGASGVPADARPSVERGGTIYAELCATCHGPDGRGTPVEGVPGALLGPPLIDTNRIQGHRDYVIKTLLHGMTGPLDGRTYGVMVPMGTNPDQWIADVGSYIRSGFGTPAWLITPADVARVRAETASRKTMWTLQELEASLPRMLMPEPTWKAGASHNAAGATGAFNFSGWSSKAPQQAGMWFQIELPAPLVLSEFQFDSPAQGGNGGPAAAAYPRAYQVQVSDDGRTWSSPVAEGRGAGVTTVVNFAPVRTKFVRMTQTASEADAPVWFIRNVRLFQAPAAAPANAPSAQPALQAALTFHASFDGGLDAVRAAGDPALYSAPAFKERRNGRRGLPEGGEVTLARGEGRFGDALRFTRRKSPVVFFKGAGNVPYVRENWSGSISFWLSVDPARDLEPGFCDPVQITSRAWNDAAFFVEFEKRPESIPFRLGVYSDFKVWNPGNRPFAEIPQHEKPLVPVEQPPFAGGKWTHVVVAFERFNTKKPDGVARLYLDGKPYGTLSPREQTFTWEPEEVAIGLGLGYIGLLDELSVFARALTDAEVRQLYELPRGVTGLLR